MCTLQIFGHRLTYLSVPLWHGPLDDTLKAIVMIQVDLQRHTNDVNSSHVTLHE